MWWTRTLNGSSRFATIGDLRGINEDDDADDEPQDFFAGGEKS
jgi:hypothetical protein